MEVIENMDDVWQVVAYGSDVGLAHVGGHGPNPDPRPPQARPERLQGVDAFAVADEDNGARDEIEHHGQIVMAFAHSDLVDGDLPQLVELGLAEASQERAGLDVLDGVPAYLQVLGHVLDGHVLRQFQGIAFEGTRVMLAWIGKAQLHLPHLAAGETQDARHLQSHLYRLGANGHSAEGSFDASLGPNVAVAAVGAAQTLARPLDGKGHLTSLEGLSNIAISHEAEGVIQ